MSNSPIQPINKCKGIKKWSFCDTSTLLDYLENHPDLEKPNPGTYYTKLIAETNINVEPIRWELVRKKVDQLKVVYLKTENWMHLMSANKNDDCHLTQVEIEVQAKKMCPHLLRLRKIFGKVEFEKKPMQAEGIEEKLDDRFSSLPFFYEDLCVNAQENNIVIDMDLPETSSLLSDEGLDLDFEVPSRSLPRQNARNASKTAPASLSPPKEYNLQTEKALLRLEWKRLQFERYKFSKLYDLKKLQIERNYELRKLELENNRAKYNT